MESYNLDKDTIAEIRELFFGLKEDFVNEKIVIFKEEELSSKIQM